MDMHETQNFIPPVAVAADAAQGRSSIVAVLCLMCSIAAWVYISYWSIQTVAYGIETAKLYPPNFGRVEVLGFATALQVIVSLFGLAVGFFFLRWALLLCLPLVLGVYLLVNGFEVYHGVLAQHKVATAPAALNQTRAEIDKLNQRITTASAQIKAAYHDKKIAYEQLAKDAANGLDRTGIAKCGPICQNNREKLGTATARFSHLALEAAPPPALTTTDADLRAQLTDAMDRASKLSAASKDLSTFYMALDESAAPAMVIDEVVAIATAVQAKTQKLGHLHTLSSFTLALDQTNEAFADLQNGKLPQAESRLPLVYGALPALALLALALIIRASLTALGPGYYGVGHSAFAWASEALQAKILPRVEALSERNFVDRLRIRTRRWMGV